MDKVLVRAKNNPTHKIIQVEQFLKYHGYPRVSNILDKLGGNSNVRMSLVDIIRLVLPLKTDKFQTFFEEYTPYTHNQQIFDSYQDTQSVLYIGDTFTKDKDDSIYKFGCTTNLKRRTQDHIKTWGLFKLVAVIPVHNHIICERSLKKHQTVKRFMYYKNTTQTELVRITKDFTVDNLIEIAKQVATEEHENVKEAILTKQRTTIKQFVPSIDINPFEHTRNDAIYDYIEYLQTFLQEHPNNNDKDIRKYYYLSGTTVGTYLKYLYPFIKNITPYACFYSSIYEDVSTIETYLQYLGDIMCFTGKPENYIIKHGNYGVCVETQEADKVICMTGRRVVPLTSSLNEYITQVAVKPRWD